MNEQWVQEITQPGASTTENLVDLVSEPERSEIRKRFTKDLAAVGAAERRAERVTKGIRLRV
jgi:hypothetical protein